MPLTCSKTFGSGGIRWCFTSEDHKKVYFGGSNSVCGATCGNKQSLLLRHQQRAFCFGNEECLKELTALIEGYATRHEAGERFEGFTVDVENGVKQSKLAQKFRQRPDVMKLLKEVIESANGLHNVVLSSQHWTVLVATALGDGVEQHMSKSSAAVAKIVTRFEVEGNFLDGMGVLSKQAGRDLFLSVAGAVEGVETMVIKVQGEVAPRLVDATALGLPRVGAAGPPLALPWPRAHVVAPKPTCTAAPRQAAAPLALPNTGPRPASPEAPCIALRPWACPP